MNWSGLIPSMADAAANPADDPVSGGAIRVLVIDLNNFSMYPTPSIGYLVASLRRDGMEVDVLSPLAFGVPGVARERPENALTNVLRRANYALHQVPGAAADLIRRVTERLRTTMMERRFPAIGDLLPAAELARYDVVLVSTYLMYYPVCLELGQRCAAARVPLLIGGSYFSEPEVAAAWRDIPGLSGLIAGEVEIELPRIVRQLLRDGQPPRVPGLWHDDGGGGPRPPLQQLDDVAFPDYADFPWDKYPHRIIPIITGRGCGWGACTFCSDVTSSAGRSFRSRSVANVLDEIRHQSQRHQTSLFAFTDLKLNSDLDVWEGLLSNLGRVVSNPRWIASVHVGLDQPNGLDRESLRMAAAAGAVRLTTGLESGSQRVLDRWAKGTDLATTSAFLEDAARAGISVRVTMIHGAPGETAADVDASARYLRRHRQHIDRVSLNRFQLMIGPTFLRRVDARPERSPSVIVTDREPRHAYVRHRMSSAYHLDYFRATQRLLQAVYEINRKPLPAQAREFDGVM